MDLSVRKIMDIIRKIPATVRRAILSVKCKILSVRKVFDLIKNILATVRKMTGLTYFAARSVSGVVLPS